jgi:protein-S-isoprenylcysteine O-methyltransferase Ste14
MSAPRSKAAAARVSAWRHVRAIALLPMMSTLVIPGALLAVSRGGGALGGVPRSAFDGAALLAGGLLLALGLVLAVKAIGEFVAAGQGTLAPWDPARRMLTGGVYRLTRNPLKIGLFAILLGEAAALRSVPLLAWFAVFAVANAIYIRVSEEPGLRRRFGAEYDVYCECVPRWLRVPPFARRRSLQGDRG